MKVGDIKKWLFVPLKNTLGVMDDHTWNGNFSLVGGQ